MRTLNDVIGKLPPARQAKVEARASALIAEELTLQDIRRAQKLTQEQMAKALTGADLRDRQNLCRSVLQKI